MSSIVVICIVVICIGAVLLALAAGGWARYGRRRLRAPFGAEVGSVAEEYDGPRAVDRELRRRRNLNDGLLLRTISAPDRAAYARSWSRLQHEFPGSPAAALSDAERLVAQLLDARGYPGVDLADQLALLSVEHPVCWRATAARSNSADMPERIPPRRRRTSCARPWRPATRWSPNSWRTPARRGPGDGRVEAARVSPVVDRWAHWRTALAPSGRVRSADAGGARGGWSRGVTPKTMGPAMGVGAG